MPGSENAVAGAAVLPEHLGAGTVELWRWRHDHADALLEAMRTSFAELNRWLPRAAAVPTPESVASQLEHDIAAFDAGTTWQYALVDPATGELVGGAGLTDRGRGTLDVDYWVRTDRTGRGFASSAARALIDAAFAHLPATERVEVRMDLANAAGAAVARRLGLRLLGEELRQAPGSDHSAITYVWMVDRATWRHVRATTPPRR